jgi:integrase/recombinase XerC
MSQFSATLDSFLDYLIKEKGYSGHTLDAYRRDLGRFGAFVETNARADSLEKIMEKRALRAFTSSLAGQGLKPRSIARKVAALKSFSKYCVKRGLLPNNAARSMAAPRLDRPLPAFLTERQARALSPSVPAGAKPRTLLEARNKAIVELLYGSGIRLAELHALNAGAIQWKATTVRVMGKGKKERIVPLTGQAVSLIREYASLRGDASSQGQPLFVNKRGARLSDGTLNASSAPRSHGYPSRKKRARMSCATRSPRTCSTAALISGRSRSSSATPPCRRPRFIPIFQRNTCLRCTVKPTPAPGWSSYRFQVPSLGQLPSIRR